MICFKPGQLVAVNPGAREAKVLYHHKNRPHFVRIQYVDSGEKLWMVFSRLKPVVDKALLTARREYVKWLRAQAKARIAANKYPDEVTPHPEGKWVIHAVKSTTGWAWIADKPNGQGAMISTDYKLLMNDVQIMMGLEFDKYLEELWTRPCVNQ